MVARLIGILLFLDGFYLALQVACLSGLSATVLGGTGIAGLVAGIVFRELRENYLASILVSIRNPFRLGDLVKQSFEQENISMPDEAREILFPEGVPFRMVESPSTPEGEGTTNVVSPAKNCN